MKASQAPGSRVDHGQTFDSEVTFANTWIREYGSWRNMHAHASLAVDVPA